MTEAELRALGIERIPVPVPFPQAGGPVNVYLLEEEDGGLLMFDSGLGTPQAQEALVEGFRRAGRSFDEVRRIVLSHGHVDHYGAALTVCERAGRPVPVYVHPADADKVSKAGRRWTEQMPLYGRYFLKLGVPAEVLATLASAVGGGYTLARRIPEVQPLEPGAVLRTRHLALEVHHMPGHTPGLCCLYERQRKIFFSADHLLEKVSPNPIIELGPNGEEGLFRPLLAYVRSVQRLRALEVDVILPGHGPPFGGHRQVIDALLEFYGKRQARILELIRASPRSGYEVTQALFPGARAVDLFLVMSETVANLEVLEERGEIVRRVEEERYRFEPARREPASEG
jgi:glyoxylase-like metal-dependent hydrolase (beta-lactamase superfamily II)